MSEGQPGVRLCYPVDDMSAAVERVDQRGAGVIVRDSLQTRPSR
jgi:hypothetical protein